MCVIPRVIGVNLKMFSELMIHLNTHLIKGRSKEGEISAVKLLDFDYYVDT